MNFNVNFQKDIDAEELANLLIFRKDKVPTLTGIKNKARPRHLLQREAQTVKKKFLVLETSVLIYVAFIS